ncbi:aminomethyltransferase gcvT [Tropheryma whipplei TW08/27]|nr:aminomethyltransferase gcvT [Tropheryma whipplei TW08/27]
MAMTRVSPLDNEHKALGAIFTCFAGYKLPVRYKSDIAEHTAVRQGCGIFDLSHMAEIFVSGVNAGLELDIALTGHFSDMTCGRAKYTLILNEQGGIEDDLIVYRIDDKNYMVVANAINRKKVFSLLRDRVHTSDIKDETDSISLVAVQGPESESLIRDLFHESGNLRYFSHRCYPHGGTDRSEKLSCSIVARTGYTGEDGFEIFTPNDSVVSIWRALIERGATPCGLAARNTLRIEAGMPLYGHELRADLNPVQAGLERFISPPCIGCDRINHSGDFPLLVGLSIDGRRAAREGYTIYSSSNIPVGTVTSGCFSPTLGCSIAMAYVKAKARSAQLYIDIRGSMTPCKVVPMPFYRR